jgi:hypothetical protein
LDDPDRNGRYLAHDRVRTKNALRYQFSTRKRQGNISAGYRGAARSSVGLNDVAVQKDLALTEPRQIDYGAKAPADKALYFLRSA